jgi:hypothetical protein
VLIVKIQHANPFYDDSYAVNSANAGPYGDAIETELIPAIEKQFHGIGQSWARFMYGGSTGGWEALAVQVFYPEHYNGAFAACPDPVDFHAYTDIDIYNDKNFYYLEGAHKRVAQSAMRDYLGHTFITNEEINGYELALGDHGRSGEQYDIWQAVFGPVGEDGYPAPIYDKVTGEIDHKVAEYWREHYDLEAILERNWVNLGPKLGGKNSHLCGFRRHLLSEQRRLPHGRLPQIDEEPAIRRRSGVWAARRALLEWRPDTAQCLLAAALQHPVPVEDS